MRLDLTHKWIRKTSIRIHHGGFSHIHNVTSNTTRWLCETRQIKWCRGVLPTYRCHRGCSKGRNDQSDIMARSTSSDTYDSVWATFFREAQRFVLEIVFVSKRFSSLTLGTQKQCRDDGENTKLHFLLKCCEKHESTHPDANLVLILRNPTKRAYSAAASPDGCDMPLQILKQSFELILGRALRMWNVTRETLRFIFSHTKMTWSPTIVQRGMCSINWRIGCELDFNLAILDSVLRNRDSRTVWCCKICRETRSRVTLPLPFGGEKKWTRILDTSRRTHQIGHATWIREHVRHFEKPATFVLWGSERKLINVVEISCLGWRSNLWFVSWWVVVIIIFIYPYTLKKTIIKENLAVLNQTRIHLCTTTWRDPVMWNIWRRVARTGCVQTVVRCRYEC